MALNVNPRSLTGYQYNHDMFGWGEITLMRSKEFRLPWGLFEGEVWRWGLYFTDSGLRITDKTFATRNKVIDFLEHMECSVPSRYRLTPDDSEEVHHSRPQD
jgi:hypothetical protein